MALPTVGGLIASVLGLRRDLAGNGAASEAAALEWIAAGALPQPIRPLKGRGRLYYRRADLMRALKEL